jgi:CxxC-x17-CxxC domain-containing protein
VKLAAVDLGSRQIVDEFYKEFKEHKKKFPKAAYQGFKNLNCIGDHLYNCKNSLDCFDCYGLEDCRYCVAVFLPLKDSYDCFECGLNASLLYQSIHGFESYNTKFTCYGGGAENVEYCHHPHSNCKNCFGCVGLRKKQYCIFNKQYGEEEYFKLKEKIVAHMKETGEYGQFFPPEISPWGYNETMAGLYFPLSKDEAMKQGFKWNDQEGEYKSSAYRIPDNIKDVSDDILQATLADRETGRNYRIIKQELDYYRQHNIPVPVNAFVERHKRRLALRNPKKLWQRQCAKCGQQMMTAYSPESEEVVYCKECFTKEVY